MSHIVIGADFCLASKLVEGEASMWLDILRLGVTFGVVVLLIAFWYWLMDNAGTF